MANETLNRATDYIVEYGRTGYFVSTPGGKVDGCAEGTKDRTKATVFTEAQVIARFGAKVLKANAGTASGSWFSAQWLGLSA